MAAHLQLLLVRLLPTILVAGLVPAAPTRPLLLDSSGSIGLGVGQSYDQGHRQGFRQRGDWEDSRWPLKGYGIRDDWASTLGSKSICSEVTLLTAPGVLCNIEGAAPYLMAARFAGYLLQGGNATSGSTTEQTSGEANQKRSYSTDEHVPWMVADYVISQGASQAGVGIIKQLRGEAQVDVFLCMDANCNGFVDIQTIIPYDESNPMSKLSPDDGSWCKDAPSKCQEVGAGGQKKQSPRRAILFSRLHIGNRLAVPVAIRRDMPKHNYARPLSNTNRDDATVHELVWGESSASWDKGDQVMMPVGTLVRLALWGETETAMLSNDLAVPAKRGDGFEALHYGMYRVHDPWTNETFCTVIVVPSSVWYDEHGWNASHRDPGCANASDVEFVTKHAFVYDSYFRQSVFVDERVKVVGRVSNSKEYIPGSATQSITFGTGETDTHGLLFDPDPALISLPGPLQLNKTALGLYGYHLGLAVRPVQSMTLNLPNNGRYGFSSYASANCTRPACRILVVGSAVRQLTDITKERFASPLNYNPTFTMYWSAHKRDQIFGAKWDSYRYRWTGGSVHNPEYEDEDLNKNMATAIAAARNTTAPVFGIHILPAWSDANRTAYLAWLQHFPENCMHLLQIPRKHFRFQKPTTWERGDMYAGNPRWDVNIIVTGNAKGFEAHLPYWESGYMTRFLQTLQDAINQSLPDDKEIQDISMYYNPPSSNAPPSTSHQPTLLTPKQLSKMGYPKQTNGSESLRDDSATSQDPPAMVDASTTLDDLETQLATALPTAPPLRYNWKNYAYTDGSYKQTSHKTSPMDAECDTPGIGAGVYFPPQAANEDDERGVPIVPAGDSHPQNTINRAELVGILAALRHGAHMIATDSLSSMYQIKKMLRRPQDLLNHQHCELIKEIVTEIVNRGLRTTLHKVKGHASIIGNERADAIAKAAATGDTSDYEECEKYESPSNNRLTQYWPHKTQWNNRWSRTNNGQRTLIDRFKRVNPLTDLHDSVRHYCHQKSRFGMANRATCYFEAFKRIEERLDLPASNEYMTSGKIKYAERKTALRYRYGTMWTRKMAYRCGHAPSSKCLLCGDEDGGHHTASGCPALKRMYINRHNKVGRLIMTRVLRGRKGAFVIQMDLGSTENCAEDGIMAHQSRNIPWELLPRGLKEAVQQAQGTTDKRPDGMLYKPKNGNNPAEYWIIEVKICRDSDPTGQQSKADYQHQVLIDKIKDIDPTAKVWYYPLLVGVAGTIYNSTTMNLQALGIKGQALKQCISEVHTAAVKSLHSIYTTKRKLEKPKEPQWHRRNYKKVS